MNMCLILMQDSISNFDPLAIISIFYTVSMFVISIILLSRQPTEGKRSSFQVSENINITLLMKLFGLYFFIQFMIQTFFFPSE